MSLSPISIRVKGAVVQNREERSSGLELNRMGMERSMPIDVHASRLEFSGR